MTTDERDPDVTQAELAGVTPEAFTARLTGALEQLRVAAEQARKNNRTAATPPGAVPGAAVGLGGFHRGPGRGPAAQRCRCGAARPP